MKKLLLIALLFAAFSTPAMTVYFTHTTGHCTTVTVTGTSGDAFNGKAYRFNIPDGSLELSGIDSSFTLRSQAINFYTYRGFVTFPKTSIDTANTSGNGTHVTYGTAASMFSQLNTLFFLDNSGSATQDSLSYYYTKLASDARYFTQSQSNARFLYRLDTTRGGIASTYYYVDSSTQSVINSIAAIDLQYVTDNSPVTTNTVTANSFVATTGLSVGSQITNTQSDALSIQGVSGQSLQLLIPTTAHSGGNIDASGITTAQTWTLPDETGTVVLGNKGVATFTGDGINKTFNITVLGTPAGAIVSINGTLTATAHKEILSTNQISVRTDLTPGVGETVNISYIWW